MKTLLFMRHAESEANARDVLASQLNFPLSQKGHLDAIRISEELLESENIDRIICSPLLRAIQTAAPFASAYRVDIKSHTFLLEQHLGEYSGLTYADLDSAPGYMHDRGQRWTWIPNGGGESYQMIAQRVEGFFKQLDDKPETVLIVTHAVTMRLIRACLENTLPDYPHEIANNGEIWKVSFKELGEVHHIESIFLGESANNASRA
jgi:broad specificity phosphatase PhoE